MSRYICDDCGYIYDEALGSPEEGIPPNTPFGKLPEEWTCPICGAVKSVFVPGD
ncbi:MAG: rubredoxin [Gammaproteobacteria bacterium]